MGRMLGSFDPEDELDRPDLNKCPDCGCYFATDNCPLCGKVCPPEMRREYRERAEAIGAVLGYIKHQRRREEHRNAE